MPQILGLQAVEMHPYFLAGLAAFARPAQLGFPAVLLQLLLLSCVSTDAAVANI